MRPRFLADADFNRKLVAVPILPVEVPAMIGTMISAFGNNNKIMRLGMGVADGARDTHLENHLYGHPARGTPAGTGPAPR